MIPEEMQRTMQFLLDNQAGHDARLAEIEVKLDKLTDKVTALANTQQEMQEGMLAMQSEFREGLENLVAVSEETSRAVRQVTAAVNQVV
jgi:peptidoglycan hydrolase CwlO-like protein